MPHTPDTEPSMNDRCPLCDRPPKTNVAVHVGQFIGVLICLLVVALAFYWPIRWVASLYMNALG